MVHCAYALDFLVREASRRTGVALNLLRCAKSDELKAVFQGELNADALRQRLACTVYLADGSRIQLFSGSRAFSFCRENFKELDVLDASEIRGQCAQPGHAKGTVKVVDKAEHMGKMRDGDVLVSIATTPEIVPAMKKARAIVTEIGGIMSHAAIVSRELGIPCVIGTKVATKWLKDGDVVEVNATEGWVRKIR